MAKDGGLAFPVEYGPDGAPGYAPGMTLRDYFAGQALVGMLAHGGYHPGELYAAMHAYEYADAMLREREKASDV